MELKLSPSMMCADIFSLPDTIAAFEQGKIEYLHMDVMDGHFVPNFTLGTDYCKAMKAKTSIPLDLHLMIEEPESKLSWFPFGEGDIVSVHVESTAHIQKALAEIRRRGAKPYIAINPGTPLCVLEEVLDDIDGVLVMSVNPGFAGQKMVPAAPDKIRRVRAFLDDHGRADAEIEVDGNVSPENALKMRDAGANIFVLGTSALFRPDLSLDSSIAAFRKHLQEG